MTTDVSACVYCCIVCSKEKSLALLREEICWTDKGDISFVVWSIDTAGPFLLDADGNRYLLVAENPFLRWVEACVAPFSIAGALRSFILMTS